MTVTFVSNYLNHHQIPFCLAMQKVSGGRFYFVSMQPMPEFRIKLGYQLHRQYEFEIKAWQNAENKAIARALIQDSDVVIFGGGPYAPLLHNRIMQNKLTYLYSERVYKKGVWRFLSPRGQYYMRRDNTQYKNKNLYLLAASACAPLDYALAGAYRRKAYKWGYFPETKHYEADQLLKEKEPTSILWVARFIDLKHPEKALKIAQRLKKDGFHFKIRLIGEGVLLGKMQTLTEKFGLQEQVEFLHSMPYDQVRSYMERSQIFLFTSDHREGWGAVLNEAMNSGCAVIADRHIGAAPYLIHHGKNGFLYNGSVRELYNQTKVLLMHRDICEQVGRNAYLTISECWNAEVAAERFFQLSSHLLKGMTVTFTEGPCSRADIVI